MDDRRRPPLVPGRGEIVTIPVLETLYGVWLFLRFLLGKLPANIGGLPGGRDGDPRRKRGDCGSPREALLRRTYEEHW